MYIWCFQQQRRRSVVLFPWYLVPHIPRRFLMRPFFAVRAKKPLHTGVRTGSHYLVCRCVCTCDIRRFYWLRELYQADFHKLGIYGSGRVWASAWDVFSSRAVSSWSRSPGCCGFRVCFGWGRFVHVFFFSIFFSLFERTRPAASMRPPCLIYLSTINSTYIPGMSLGLQFFSTYVPGTS